MVKFQIVLADEEWKALVKVAAKEMRYPRDQAVLVLREFLTTKGLLPVEHCAQVKGDNQR